MTLPTGFKPNLAINYDDVKTQPDSLYCAEKLDGIRVVFFGGVAYSRSLKLIPNLQVQALAKRYQHELEGCDGEIIAGDLYANNVLQRSNSFAMSADKQDDFKIYLFDRYTANTTWIDRYSTLSKVSVPDVEVLEHYAVRQTSKELGKLPWVDLDLFEQQVLERGGEGVILRDGNGYYKFGRSASKEPEIQKLKRFQDDEFMVVGYTQFEHNTNEAKTNELGRTQRSSHKEGKVAVDALGSLVCSLGADKTFNVGTGFTESQRSLLWSRRDNLVGKLAKVKFFHYSYDNVPLLPVFLGFRDERDI